MGFNVSGSELFSRHTPGGVFMFGSVRQAPGNIFYVDGDNSDATDSAGYGRSPDKPFATISFAISQCTANQGDLILVSPTHTETPTSTINFNVAGISVVVANWGISPLVKGEYQGILADASFTDGPVATVTAPCLIDGLAFVSRDTGATFFSGAAMLIGGQADATPFGVHVRNCRFPKWNVDNRIGIAIEGSTDVLIEDCTFEGVGASFDAGIYIQGAAQNPVIRRNHFRQCTAAVKFGAFAGGGPHIIMGPDNVVEDGLCLDRDGNTATGIVCGNWLETASGAASFGESLANLKTGGIQPSGNHYADS